MGLFTRNFDKPGPGVREDEPRKKGVARVWEVFSRDGWSLFRAGFLAFLSSIPFFFLVSLSIQTHVLLYLLLGGILGGMLMGPQLTGIADTVLRALRDEPGYWWATYKRAWKRNAKASLVPGAVVGLALGSQAFTLFHLTALGSGILMWALFILGLFVSLGLSVYLWPQIALVDLPFGTMVKNAVLLLLGYLPRSLGAVAFQLVYWVLFLLFFPLTTLLLPVTGLWLPLFLGLFVIYPPLNKTFHVEEEIRKLRDAELDDPL